MEVKQSNIESRDSSANMSTDLHRAIPIWKGLELSGQRSSRVYILDRSPQSSLSSTWMFLITKLVIVAIYFLILLRP